MKFKLKSQFVTLRGFLLLFLISFYFIFPIQKEDDIIASMICLCFFIILVFALITTITNGEYLRKKIEIKLFTSSFKKYIPEENTSKYSLNNLNSDENISSPNCVYALDETSLFFNTKNVKIFPFFELNIKFEFKFEQPSIESIILNSSFNNNLGTGSIIFPHRGIWEIDKLYFEFGDILGLCSLKWNVDSEQISFRILPQKSTTANYPVISSSSIPGDTYVDLYNKQGDPYDLKQYSPSDGIKRILWKAYAKSGQLITRTPESSITPEGYTLIFVIAGINEDRVADEVYEYTKNLYSSSLTIYLSACGATRKIATNPEDAIELLIDGVWSINFKDCFEEFSFFIKDFQQKFPESNIKNIVFFFSDDFGDANKKKSLLKITDYCNQINIQPVLAFVRIVKNNESLKNKELYSKWFFNSENNKEQTTSNSVVNRAFENELYSLSLKSNWQVL